MVAYERPAYYRPPRCRPVTFEIPQKIVHFATSNGNQVVRFSAPTAGNHRIEIVTSRQAPTRVGQQFVEAANSGTSSMSLGSRSNTHESANSLLSRLPDHNRAPRPFNRQYLTYKDESKLRNPHYSSEQNLYNGPQCRNNWPPQQQQQHRSLGPRILVGDYEEDKKADSGLYDNSIVAPYPTSTVHKSLLNSGQRSNQRQEIGTKGQPTAPLFAYDHDQQLHNRPPNDGPPNLCQSCSNRRAVSEVRFASTGDSGQRNVPNIDYGYQRHEPIELGSQFVVAPQASNAGLDGQQWQHQQWQQQQQQQQQRQWHDDQRLNLALPKSRPRDGQQDVHSPVVAVGRQYQRTKFGGGSTLMPDTRQQEFMRTKRLEQATIAHQTYRTLPIVQPRPKARHDLSLGTTYMNLNQDPTYDLAIESSKQSKLALSRKIEAALNEGRRFIRE